MPAPKGNKFAIGNSGREKKWNTPEELEEDIEKYYEKCDSNTKIVLSKEGELITVPKPIPYTIEGLCEVLECDRDTLLNYQKQKGYEEFFGTIKKAKNKIARNKTERGLMGESNAAVTIFDLKNNHGYKDKQEIDQTIEDKTDLSKLSTEELIKRAEAINKISEKTQNE